MLTATALKALLREHGLRLTKRLGQSYLIDERAIARIVSAAACRPDEDVLEIGAGLGALTGPLAAQARHVTAVEVDRKIAPLLAGRLRERANVDVVCGDILEQPPERFRDVVVVGAVPYHITSPIFVLLTERRHAIRRAVIVVQTEVADRLVAGPGTKAYGRLSVLARYGWDTERVCDLPSGAFFPQPEVGSTCLRLAPRQALLGPADERAFFRLVQLAFGQRRKTLVNCLTRQEGAPEGLSKPRVEDALGACGIPAGARGEALGLEAFLGLARHLREEFAAHGAR